MSDQIWHVVIEFTEDGDRTRADTFLELESLKCHGFGQSKRRPEDSRVASIGEELAAARSLLDLSHQLLLAATERIERSPGL